MAFVLTDRNKSLKDQIGINPQAILQIEGLDTVFGSQAILEFARWDLGIRWDDGTRWDGYVEKAGSLDVIDLGTGTTTNITQQIFPDKASSGSVSSVNIRLVDISNEVSQIFSFDNITEILGKKADFYIGFKQGAFPEDAIPVFRGVVIDFFTENGAVTLSVAHPDTLKRQDIFEQYQSQLTENVKYQQLEVQDLTYKQRDPTKPTLSIEYVNSGANVSLTLDVITINVAALTTAGAIASAVRNDPDVNFVVQVEVTGDENTVQTTFAQTLFDIDTTINVISTETLLLSQDALTSYILVNDEIMKVTGKTDTTIDVERAQFGTLGATHEGAANEGDEVTSQYRLTGDPIDLSLKLMLSSEGNEFFRSDDIPKRIENNQLIFDYYDIQDLTGLVIGDLIQLTGVNAGTYTIKNFGLLQDGSFIETNETLTNVGDFQDEFYYKSYFNTLPDGLGMLPFQVDTDQHLSIRANNPAFFVDYEIDLKETLEDAKKFIEEQIYFPQGLYAIPRKARSSVKLVLPPLSSEVLPTINTQNITNLDKIRQRRSIHKYHYNVYRIDFEKDELEDKFKRKEILINNDSKTRIKSGNKVFKIESDGFRDNPATLNAITNILQRYKDRYSFAPTYFEGLKVKYGTGFNVEVGDIIPFGGEDTKIVDLQTGKRNAAINLFEIINKSLNIKTGEIKLDLLQTSFNINARYAVFSQASKVGAGATTTKIPIKRILDTGEFTNESDKWSDFALSNIRVRSEDYTFDEEVQLVGVDPQNVNNLIVQPLSSAPLEGYIIEIPLYENTNQLANDEYKLRFSHMCFQGKINGVTNDSTFDVEDASGLFVGSRVVVSSLDYTRDSFGETYTIDDITGNTITLDKDLPFTPVIGDKIENSNFGDGGFPYELL